MTLSWPTYGLVVAAVLYWLGGRRAVAAPPRWRGAAFYAGLLTLLVAIDSPVDTYAGRWFWVHMTQHVLLMMVAPPLLILGRPWPRLVRPLPHAVRRPVARVVVVAGHFLASPLPAFVLFNTALLLWHLPVLYDLTLRDGPVHELEHTLFLGTGLLLWPHLLPSSRPQLTDAWRVAYGTGALLVSWLLAVVLGLATHPLYAAYPSLTDQQVAAGIMWVPGSIPFCIALFVAAYRWLDPASGTRRPVLRPRET